MKTILLAPLLILSLFSAKGYSAEPFGENSVEQQATQKTEENLTNILEQLNKACGTNATLTIDWPGYAPAFNSFPENKRDNRDITNIYANVEHNTDAWFRGLRDYCNDNAIFKANVQKKLKEIRLQPSRTVEVSAKNPSHIVRLQAGVMVITHHLFTSNTSYDELRKIF